MENYKTSQAEPDPSEQQEVRYFEDIPYEALGIECRSSSKGMEDLEPISEVQQNLFCVELMKRLNMQRRQDYLCDITLVAKEGKEFKGHRNVLSAVSPFFVKLFQSEMKEKEEGIIRFEEISASILESVLEFIYTGHLMIINERNAKDLIIAADFLLLVCLKTFAGRFLEQRLSNSNCISTFYFAEKYQCEELVAKTRKFIYDNFASVAQSDEFLNLGAEEVKTWISSDEICIAAEEDILTIIQTWIEKNESNRKAQFEELFCHVRLVLVSRDILLDFVCNKLVKENHCCLRKVWDAMELITSASEDALMQSPRKRLETNVIVACGGNYTFCYLPEKNEWKRLSDTFSKKLNHKSEMIKFRDQLYIFPGNHELAERYDPVFNSWGSLRGIRRSQTKRVAVVRGQIYGINIDRRNGKSTIERYDVGLWSWQSILSSPEGCRHDACVIAAGNFLYVLGGTPLRDYRYVKKGERFDTVQNKWEEIADMQQERSCAFGVATQGKIFVAGGEKRSYDYSETCEVYNISTNEWQLFGNLNVPRLWGSMVCVNGTLYVLGGSRYRDEEAFVYMVESYDPIMKKWTQRASIPVDQISEEKKPSFKGCALKLPKGMLAKHN